jgi:pimeloyl-ACP methyl ester carboxylesterase
MQNWSIKCLILLFLGCFCVSITTAAEPPFAPSFAQSPYCQSNFTNRYNVYCGSVSVLEEHAHPDSGMIQIAVAVFRAESRTPQSDPVIALVGGPGQNAIDSARGGLGSFWEAVIKQHDLILMDQRGMGYSLPSLACPEVDATKMQTQFDESSTSHMTELDAAHQCLERLTEAGVNISAFNTVESAADIPDVVAALGYRDYNIWGGSYGSTLGLTVMRDHPEHLRSVTLTSITPPQVDLMADFAMNLNHNFQLLVQDCNANAQCAAAYPELENIFSDDVATLNEHQSSVTVISPVTNKPTTFAFDGDDLVGAVNFLMYNPDSAAQIPALLTSLHAGIMEGLDPLVRTNLAMVTANTDGALYAMRCMDDVMTTTRADWKAAIETIDPAMRDYWIKTMDWWYAVCDMGWGAKQLDPIENSPVYSDIPILMQSGELDPVTPPAWGDLALRTLPNGFHFVYPGSAHNAAPTVCAIGMFEQFLNDPTVKPDSACIARISDMSFLMPQH